MPARQPPPQDAGRPRDSTAPPPSPSRRGMSAPRLTTQKLKVLGTILSDPDGPSATAQGVQAREPGCRDLASRTRVVANRATRTPRATCADRHPTLGRSVSRTPTRTYDKSTARRRSPATAEDLLSRKTGSVICRDERGLYGWPACRGANRRCPRGRAGRTRRSRRDRPHPCRQRRRVASRRPCWLVLTRLDPSRLRVRQPFARRTRSRRRQQGEPAHRLPAGRRRSLKSGRPSGNGRRSGGRQPPVSDRRLLSAATFSSARGVQRGVRCGAGAAGPGGGGQGPRRHPHPGR